MGGYKVGFGVLEILLLIIAERMADIIPTSSSCCLRRRRYAGEDDWVDIARGRRD